MSDVILEIKDLYFSYNSSTVLENINLSVCKNDFLMIVGPNGGGKTTLLKLIIGLLKPQKGIIKVFDKNPCDMLSQIGYVPQKVNAKIDFPLRVIDAVLMGINKPFFSFKYSKTDIKKACSVLESVEMIDFKDKKMNELSGGQIQRVYLARALISDPALLILDEPTSNIDPYGSFCFFTMLEKLNETKTIIMVTHNLNLLATKITSVACINKYLLYNNKPELTREMMEMMYGIHDEHTCSIGAYVSEEINHLSHSEGKNR